MNKYKIRNADELHEKIALLSEMKKDQEEILTERAKLLYDEFHPVAIITSALSRVFERKTDSKNLMMSAVLFGIDAIVSNVWMKKSSENLKGVVSNLVQALAVAFLSKTGRFNWESIFNKDCDDVSDDNNDK